MPVSYTYQGEDNRPDFVEPGIYQATVVAAEEKVSKRSGNDMIELVWALDGVGLWVWDYLTFGPKTQWRIDTFLRACGHQPDGKGVEVELDSASMVGWKAKVELIVEDDGGRKRNKVLKYIYEDVPATKPAAQPAEPEAKPKTLPF